MDTAKSRSDVNQLPTLVYNKNVVPSESENCAFLNCRASNRLSSQNSAEVIGPILLKGASGFDKDSSLPMADGSHRFNSGRRRLCTSSGTSAVRVSVRADSGRANIAAWTKLLGSLQQSVTLQRKWFVSSASLPTRSSTIGSHTWPGIRRIYMGTNCRNSGI